MGQYIDRLYEAQADEAAFQQLDKMITEKVNKCLKDYRETLPALDFEKVRDAAFSAAAVSKRAAFEIGFQIAVRLILECRDR